MRLLAIGVTIDSTHEIVVAVLRGCTPSMKVFFVYRPPHHARELDETLYHDLSRVAQNGHTIIVGDFNCPLDWNLEAVGAEAVRQREFADDHFLTQVVRTPTRGRNILEIFATDEDLSQ